MCVDQGSIWLCLTYFCLICLSAGELVPINEMEHHMRVSLIDPRWKEQRDAMMARFK
jgi:hypothetical protein